VGHCFDCRPHPSAQPSRRAAGRFLEQLCSAAVPSGKAFSELVSNVHAAAYVSCGRCYCGSIGAAFERLACAATTASRWRDTAWGGFHRACPARTSVASRVPIQRVEKHARSSEATRRPWVRFGDLPPPADPAKLRDGPERSQRATNTTMAERDVVRSPLSTSRRAMPCVDLELCDAAAA